MKLHAKVPILLAGCFLLLQGCNDKKEVYELFSGTVPRIEIPDEEGSRFTTPRSQIGRASCRERV